MIHSLQVLDLRALEALYAIRDPLLVQVFIWVSEFGSGWTIYGLGCVVALLLLRKRHVAYATGLTITLATTGLGVLFLKDFVARVRPPLKFEAYQEILYSFPSAHAALSAAFYGFLIFLVWRFIARRSLRYTAIGFLVLFIAAISFSRLYLGVHYMSDVIAGILFGALCVWLGVLWIRYTEKR